MALISLVTLHASANSVLRTLLETYGKMSFKYVCDFVGKYILMS